MTLYKRQHRIGSGEVWTPQRMRIAGVLAMIGAVVLFARIAYGGYLETQMSVLPWDDVGSVAYYVNEGMLIGIWACIFVGFAALRNRMVGEGGRLWDTGITLAVIGTAVVTLGFTVVTVVPMVGAETLVNPGNALIGIGLILLTSIGTFLMGIALARMEVMSRVVAALLILHLPMGTGGVILMELIVGQQHWIGAVAVLPLCAAVVLIGNYLRTETPDVMPATHISD